MVKGLKLSLEAMKLIEEKEYDMAMSFLKQSTIECDMSKFHEPDKIRSALDKCTPNNPDAMYVQSVLFGNDIQGRILFTKRCIRSHPKDAHFHCQLSALLGYVKDYASAVKEIDVALALDSSHPRWLYLKAMYFRFSPFLSGYEDKAIACYKDYLHLNPFDDRKVTEALYTIAYLYMAKKDVENVKVFWQKAVESERVRLDECFEPVEESFYPRKMVESWLKVLSYLCANCQKPKPPFKCACLKEAYCDKSCQLASWRIHKHVCTNKTKVNRKNNDC